MTVYCGVCYRKMERHTRTMSVYGYNGSVRKSNVVVYVCPHDRLEVYNSSQDLVPRDEL